MSGRAGSLRGRFAVTAALVLLATTGVSLVGQVSAHLVVRKFEVASNELLAETDHIIALLGGLRELEQDAEMLRAGDDGREVAQLREASSRIREQLLHPGPGVGIEDGGEAKGLEEALSHFDHLETDLAMVGQDETLTQEARDHLILVVNAEAFAIAAALREATTEETEEVAGHLADARALHRRAAALATVALALSVVILVAAAVGLTRAVLRPLERFRRQVEAFAAGDRYGRAELQGVGEIREVTRSFNEMADRLHAGEVELTRQAFTDALTGLPNRAAFLERLTALAEAATRSGTLAGCALFLDLDQFKTVNDSLGHDSGDELLREVGHRIVTTLRGGEVAARLGGDEFGVLLPGTDAAEAERVAARLLEAIGRPIVVSATPLAVGASVGIARIDPGSDPSDVLRNADVAMYAAKADGRNQHRLFQPQMHAAAVARMRTENELRSALERDELVLHYQPVVRLSPGTAWQVSAVEALVRWRHPDRGLLAPSEFLDVAVDSGLIQVMGDKLLRRACSDVAAFRRISPRLAVSVNLTAQELHSGVIADRVTDAISAARIPHEALVIELTESEALTNAALATQRLTELRALGVRVAIDDFGTGYSSLSYLRQLPVDALKIDRAFVNRVTSDHKDFNLVDAILAMSRALGLETVAEGIETAEQLETLTAMGSTYGQGYHICKPQPRDELLAWLSAHDRGPVETPAPFLPLGLSR